jgi:hypothetical protein
MFCRWPSAPAEDWPEISKNRPARSTDKTREMRIAMRIRVTTRADLYERRKQEHIERGYRIEDERPVPVNGLCSFIALYEPPNADNLSSLVTEALNGNHGSRGNW